MKHLELAEAILRTCKDNAAMIMAYKATGGASGVIYQHSTNPRITALAVAQEAIKTRLTVELLVVLEWMEKTK